jgi:SAM-dependent methyltransferase
MPNYFASESAADRYARARPAFHHHVIDRLRPHFGASLPFDRAIDVGCGTGLSTAALESLAFSAFGLDPSLPMLQRTAESRGIAYVAGSGEALPFQDAVFDLLTVSSAFHWFDRMLFLAEARRVLRRTGLLVVYDNYFSGRAVEADGLRNWVFHTYRSRYPSPARAELRFPTDVSADLFLCVHHEEYENTISFTQEALVDYLLTQTNVIAAVEEGCEPIEDVRAWLNRELHPHFPVRGSLTVRFGGPIWILAPV